jgi:molybdenum ABC transporter molybdate-binding protein
MSGEPMAEPAWGEGWGLDVRVWIERAGQAVLGPGRLELLEGIARYQSISAAARQMGMSYRHAWLMVQRINEASGKPLVASAVGGTGGGGASLTPQGRWTVTIFRELQEQVRRTAAAQLHRLVQPTEAPTVHVAAAVSLEDVLGQLWADFALSQPTVRIRAVFGASDELADHILAGTPTDLFLTADACQLDRLDAVHLIETETRLDLAENSLTAIGSADRDLPVSRPAHLTRPAVAQVALAAPSCPLGGYTQTYLENLGLYDAILSRATLADNSRAVVAAVRAGRADIGFVYDSDAAGATDCRVLFRAGRHCPKIRFQAAVVRSGQQAAGARILLQFLSSTAGASRFRQCGFLSLSTKQS